MKEVVPDYLMKRMDRIQNYPAQVLHPISHEYRQWSHPLMRRLYRSFPDYSIQREDLVDLYKSWKQPALALIATLVWGRVDVRKAQRLQKVLNAPEKVLAATMENIRKRVQSGDLERMFLSCCRDGTNRIEGIGPSYFTKVFFFVGETNGDPGVRPLILDRWTTNAFFVLRGQEQGRKSLACHFTFPSSVASLEEKQAVSLKGNLSVQANAYSVFSTSMNAWADGIGVIPAKLEQFVFGVDRRIDNSSNNPRNEILAEAKKLIA